jgi:hypothetical protein
MADHWDSALSTEQWSHFFYTQTFESAPGQMATAAAGEIGLGTHTASVMPKGSLFTAALGLAGVAAGMGVVLL